MASDAAHPNSAWSSLLVEQANCNARLYFRIAYRFLKETAQAEDACQRAFLAAWERPRADVRSTAQMRAWLTRVLINECLQILRRQKLETRVHGLRILSAESGERMGGAQHLSEPIVSALERLPDATRVVVVLRIMQGMSGTEVSGLLGCGASEVSRRLYDGMDRLRGLLRGLAGCSDGS